MIFTGLSNDDEIKLNFTQGDIYNLANNTKLKKPDIIILREFTQRAMIISTNSCKAFKENIVFYSKKRNSEIYSLESLNLKCPDNDKLVDYELKGYQYLGMKAGKNTETFTVILKKGRFYFTLKWLSFYTTQTILGISVFLYYFKKN